MEEVKKIVEIRIEEGYERGGYDHRHYQTHTTTWSEYEDEGRSHSEDKEEGGKIPSNDYSSEEEEGVSQGGFSTNTALYDSSVASDSSSTLARHSNLQAGNSNTSVGNSNLVPRNSKVRRLKASDTGSNIVRQNLNTTAPDTASQLTSHPINSYSHELHTIKSIGSK